MFLETTKQPITSIVVSPDQNNILTLDANDTLVIWDMRVMQPLIRYKSHLFADRAVGPHDWGIRLTDRYLTRQKLNRVIADRIDLPLEDPKRD